MPAGEIIKLTEEPVAPVKKLTPYQKHVLNNPLFKEKRKAYMKEVLVCKICGKSSIRSNMSHHHNSKQCKDVATQATKKAKREEAMKIIQALGDMLAKVDNDGVNQVIMNLKDVVSDTI